MTHNLTTSCILLLGLVTDGAIAADELVDHRLEVRLYPSEQRLQVRDRIRLPEAAPLEFSLHQGLDPHIITPGASLSQTGLSLRPNLQENYRVNLPEGTREFVLEYGGRIAHDFQTREESPGRDQQLLAGTISTGGSVSRRRGRLVSGVSGQPPEFPTEREVPAGWHVVSQGAGPRESNTTDGQAADRLAGIQPAG